VSALLAVLAAGLCWLGFAGVGWWPLALVGFVPLFAALERAGHAGGGRVFGVGLLFGSLLWGATCSWVVGTLRTFSGLPLPACLAISLLFFVAHGGLFACFGWLFWRARRRGAPAALAAAAAIAACELVYPRLFPGYYGASLHRLPLVVQIAELGGPLALSALCLAVNGALYELRARRGAAVMAACLLAVLAYGAVRTRQVEAMLGGAPRLRVGIVQPNMEALAKWTELREGERRLIDATRELEAAVRPDLIVWPENAWAAGLPLALGRLPESVRRAVRTPLLFGSWAHPRAAGGRRALNRVLLADERGEIQGSYDKVELMPFGEYLPFEGVLPPGLRSLWPARASVVPGRNLAPLSLHGFRISAFVCLEDLLPGFVRRVMREGSPHLLVNLSNDAWFGSRAELRIHLALAELRAVEQRRYLVRATNTGVSAVIDPLGRVVAQSGAFTRETLSADVAMLEGRTPYQVLGDWPGWLAVGTILWLAPLRRAAR
jgi:apolipoprotein N-acyltransferase